MVPNRWKGEVSTGPLVPCTSESFSKKRRKKKTKQAQHCNLDHLLSMWCQCKESLARVYSSCNHRQSTALKVGLELSCLPLCLAVIAAGLNGFAVPPTTFTTHVILWPATASAQQLLLVFSCCCSAPNLNWEFSLANLWKQNAKSNPICLFLNNNV